MELEGHTRALPLLLPAPAAQSAAKPALQATGGRVSPAAPVACLPAAFGSPVVAESGAAAGEAGPQAVEQAAAAEQAVPSHASASPAAAPPRLEAAVQAAAPLACEQPASLEQPLPTPFDAAASGGGWGEPTITLNTRDAFAAINHMFGVRSMFDSGA